MIVYVGRSCPISGVTRRPAFAPPCQRLLVQHVQVGFFRDYLIAKLHCLRGLRLAKVLVRWAGDVVVPHPAANCVEYDPLKAVIVSNRPVPFAGLREYGHDRARQMEILLDKCVVRCLKQIETALHRIFQLWAEHGPIGYFLQTNSASSRMPSTTKMELDLHIALKIWHRWRVSKSNRTKSIVRVRVEHTIGLAGWCRLEGGFEAHRCRMAFFVSTWKLSGGFPTSSITLNIA